VLIDSVSKRSLENFAQMLSEKMDSARMTVRSTTQQCGQYHLRQQVGAWVNLRAEYLIHPLTRLVLTS
jgi:hypothetical protein